MKVFARTDIGLCRASNQDSLLVQDGKYGLFGVADGMGGHNAGDVASQTAVRMLGRVLAGAKPDETLLRAAIEEVNALIFEEQKKDVSLSGMGTTLTVLWEDEDRVLLGHVGDSRAYLMRGGKLSQISRDHSLVGEMLREGLITREQAKTHPYRNVITRAVGTAEEVEADLLSLDKKAGDRFLLCSDGLTEYADEAALQSVLENTSGEEAVETLMRLALQGGGQDNITVLLAEVEA